MTRGPKTPCLTLMTLDAPQFTNDLREVFSGVRYVVHSRAAWRVLPNDLPRWHAVYEQAHRWSRAGVFARVAHDLREVLRIA